jgi:hypothetical protein
MSSILPRPARLAPLALLALVGACASPPEAPVATASTPPLVLEQFFPGRTVGQGVFTNSWTASTSSSTAPGTAGR